MLSVLQLRAVRLERLVLRSRPGPVNSDQRESYSLLVERHELPGAGPGDERYLRLRVRLRPRRDVPEVHSFEDVDVVLTGVFAFADRASEELKKVMYPLTAVAMLYGIARGIVAQTTGPFPTGTFLLPPLDVTAAVSRRRITATCELVPAGVPTTQACLAPVADATAPV